MAYKAFALSGRQACGHEYPGRCPGLGASALSGREGNGRGVRGMAGRGVRGMALFAYIFQIYFGAFREKV